jgi:predicted lipoprotein with Yx(FWY)xxD motif
VTALAGCGKTIQIGNTTESQSASAAPASSAPAATTTSGAASSSSSSSAGTSSNAALQVVDSTAAQAGLHGNGGTVVGVAVQEAPPRWVQFSAVTSDELPAQHLININQAALYRFDDDSASPSKSACANACIGKWPPVTVEEGGKVYMAGVDPKEVGAIRREDGQIQITVGGRPIYRYSGDSKPGDLNGQGVDGKWFAVGPKGEKVTGKQ